MSFRGLWANTTFVYFLGLLTVGGAYIAILPPFEGFDENAHFSRIMEVASSSYNVLTHHSFIDKSVLDYSGPMPYSSGNPPYDQGKAYPSFFSNSLLVHDFVDQYSNKLFGHGFNPSDSPNWQVQHPPLYYLLMSPLFSQLSGFSFMTQLVMLRFVSFFIAIAGLFFGYLAYRNLANSRAQRAKRLIGFVFYPIILPMFFLEFARIGNDSLCILIIGLIAYCLSLWLKNRDRFGKLFIIGTLLGTGLLTKAFFIPITLGLVFFLVIQHSDQKVTKAGASILLGNLGILLTPVIIIGGSWYLFKILIHGDIGLGGAATELVGGAGLSSGLVNNFHLFKFLRGLLVPLVSFSWAGSWSLVRFPLIIQLPIFFLSAWIFWTFIKTLKIDSLADYESIALLMFILLYLGLAAHVLISMALTGLGASGGWYLHILSPWLAPALGKALHSILRDKFERWILLALVIYSVVFQWLAIWSHMALFSGCAVKDDDKGFLFLSSDICLNNSFVIFDRLQIIASPFVSIFLFVLGFFLLLIAMLRTFKIETSDQA